MANDNFVIEDGILIKYTGDSEELVIPNEVKYIEESAFDGRDKLTIHAFSGRCAEQYAKENNISFVAI